jgi:hypothetical protein
LRLPDATARLRPEHTIFQSGLYHRGRAVSSKNRAIFHSFFSLKSGARIRAFSTKTPGACPERRGTGAAAACFVPSRRRRADKKEVDFSAAPGL